MVYNEACNPIGTVHNVALASDLSKEPHPPILNMLEIHGVQVKREREINLVEHKYMYHTHT